MDDQAEPPAADGAPVEQLAQQQPAAQSEPVTVVHAHSVVVSTVQGHRIVLTAVDDQGRIWERSNDLPAGEWHQISGPRA